ncbi:MAG: large conductance mechanosensitive channel protein MscL [bacterium]|nr:large conductance mechanosensitive channel protein MscL [bacterium]
MLKEFKEFAMRGNVIDMAIGIVIGAAFGTIVGSLVSDMLMPPLGLLIGSLDFSSLFVVLKEGTQTPGPYMTIDAAKNAGAVTLNYGKFVNTIVNFIIIAFPIFLLVRTINKLKRKEEALAAAKASAEPTTKQCPFCYSTIHVKAVKCASCSSEL